VKKPLIEPALRTRILDQLAKRHGSALRNEHFEVDARKEGEDAVVSLVLSTDDRTSVYRMEAAIHREQYVAMTLQQSIDVALDFLDWYLGEYFREERDAFLPLDWKAFRFGDVEVMARGEVRNEFLDDMADAWLRGERPDVEGQWKQIKQRR